MKRPTEAWRDAEMFENGLGTVVIARFKANGDAEIGVFLVDVFCLGVKDGVFGYVGAVEYEDRLKRLFGGTTPVAIPPAEARALVEASVAYARKHGLEPHPDYRLAQRIFGGIDPSKNTATFTFGKDGKPFFFQGPNDSPEFVEMVLTRLQQKCGEGNFAFAVMPGSGPEGEPE
jgi:hypothetical protein